MTPTTCSRPRLRYCAAATALLLMTGLTLAGCGGKKAAEIPPPKSSGSSTATASATPSSKLGANPAPTPAHTKQSAEAFGKYFLTLVLRAYETRDMAPVWAHANRATCYSCKESEKATQTEIKQKFRDIKDGPITFHKVGAVSVGAAADYDVAIVFDLPPAHRVGDSGKVITKLAGGPKSSSEVLVNWVNGQWQVKNYSLVASKG